MKALSVLWAACLTTGILWATFVPPFEAPDEVYISQLAYNAGRGRHNGYDPIYFALAGPLMKTLYDPGEPFDAPRNPAFRFVSGRRGHVNMFMHERVNHPPPIHVRRLVVLRALAVALALLTMTAIYLTAYLVLGRTDLALMIAGLCLFTPQFSFMASKAHPETTSMLWGALAGLLVAARGARRLTPRATWLLAVPLLLSAPFTDNTAYFLLAFVPLGLLIVEPDARVRWRSAAVLGLVAAAALVLLTVGYARMDEAGHAALRARLGPLHLVNLSRLSNPLSPFADAENRRYFLFEFWPKMFQGFWGWLGQPSILLPAWVFAALAVTTVLAAIGLIVRAVPALKGRATGNTAGPGPEGPGYREASDGEPADRAALNRFLVATVAGLFLMLLPIVYATVLWNRNAWYGRWLFPLIGPIMIAMTIGLRDFGSAARRAPHRVAAGLGIAALALGLAGILPPGDWVRSGIRDHHYGDQENLVQTIRYAILLLAITPLLVEALLLWRRWRRAVVDPQKAPASRAPLIVFGAAAVLNMVLLLAYVRPLYRPLTLDDYQAAVRAEIDRGEYRRAAALARVALDEHPDATELARIVPRMLLRAERYEDLHTYLWARLVHGQLRTREEMWGLARTMRVIGGGQGTWEPVRALSASIAGDPALREESALLRLVSGEAPAATAVAEALRGAGARPLNAELAGQAVLDGYSIHPLADGRREVVIYFRPLGDWKTRRVWVHAYAPNSTSYVDLGASPPTFSGWKPGEVAWEMFTTPAPGRFNLYAGVATGDDLGAGHPLGWVGVTGTSAADAIRAGQANEVAEYFGERISTGKLRASRGDLLGLARATRMGLWQDTATIPRVSRPPDGSPALTEAWLLLQSAARAPVSDRAAGEELLKAAGATRVGAAIRGEAVLEGYTARPAETGETEVVVYFRPTAPWASRGLWLHAYPEGAAEYQDIAASLPPIAAWQPGELAWEIFRVPRGRFNVYLGVAVGDDLGPGHPIGWLGSK